MYKYFSKDMMNWKTFSIFVKKKMKLWDFSKSNKEIEVDAVTKEEEN
jgi:hypothetical protein